MDQIKLRLLTVVLVALSSGLVFSQELRLFEEIDNQDDRVENRRPGRPGGEGPSSVVPEFTLVGTSRIGANYSVVVKHRGGEFIRTNTSSNLEVQIPGYPDYHLVEVGAGAISIRYPDNVQCHPDSNLGVSCDEDIDNLARLTFEKTMPVSSTLSISSEVASPELSTSDAEEAPVNPFAALRERARNPDSNADNSNFRPRRISSDDVPPGMRIVSTPFGDRLVEIDQ